MAKDKIQSAGGVGESKIFCVPPAERQELNAQERMLLCHINGILIGELNLDPVVISALDYFATDEGVAEKNARPDVREPSGVELVANGDPFHKALQQKRDDILERDFDTYQAQDPFRVIADKHAKPGMRAKMMSAQAVRDGGNPDYTVVKEANGDPVKCQGMILGHIPEDVARARQRYYQKQGNVKLQAIGEKYKAEGGSTAVADQ